MAHAEHLKLLAQGVAAWNRWRADNRDISPDLHGAGLSGQDLQGANLAGADLSGADLSNANLAGADLGKSNLQGADLTGSNLSGVQLSRSTIDTFTKCENAIGCDIGVNGIYSPVTDSAALMQIDPPGNSMQGANADAVIASLAHARKLHTFSLVLAGFGLLFIVIKPKTISLPYLAGSFKFDDLSYAFLASMLSTGLLSLVAVFIDSALQGARYLNDRRAAMLVGHFPWILSKYECEPGTRRKSQIMRLFLSFHPLVYCYFFVKWDAMLAGDWPALLQHYQEFPVIFGEYLLPVFYLILLRLCIQIFRISEGFQKPILFDTVTERERRTDMERLAEAVEKQALRTSELVGLLRRREER
jgi:uncharacterized protein YjbI with pentapeptide repeats